MQRTAKWDGGWEAIIGERIKNKEEKKKIFDGLHHIINIVWGEKKQGSK